MTSDKKKREEWTAIQWIIVGPFGGVLLIYGVVLLLGKISGH